MRLLTSLSELRLTAKTPHGEVPYWSKVSTVSAKDILSYCNKKYFDNLCQVGCPNYSSKWSCPPYSPAYKDFSKNYQKLCVDLLGLDMSSLDYIKQDYLKIKAANSILKSRIDKVLRACKDDDEKYISTGSCRLCKPCHKKLNEPCAHPDIRTFSYEALGVNVSSMVHDIFGIDLLWYAKGSLPLYTCVVAGLLSNQMMLDDRIIAKIKEFR